MTTASYIDFPKSGLSEEVWTGSPPVLKAEVEELVEKTVLVFLIMSSLKEEDLGLVFITGSITGRSWDEATDIDLHVVIKNSSGKVADDIKPIIVSMNKNPEMVGKHPINIYAEAEAELERKEWFGRVDSVYDVRARKWLKKSTLSIEDPYEKFKAIIEMAHSWAKKLDIDLGEARRDLVEYHTLMREMQGTSDEQQVMIRRHLTDIKEELDKDIEVLIQDNEMVHDMRVRAFETDLKKTSVDKWMDLAKQYSSKNLLPGNIIFKLLERWKYTKLLKSIVEHGELGSFEDYSRVSDEMFSVNY